MSYLVVSLASDFAVARRIAESLQPASPQVFVMDHGERKIFTGLEVLERRHTHIAASSLAGAAIGGAASAATLAVPFVGPFIFGLTAPVAAVTGGLVGAALGSAISSRAEEPGIKDALRDLGFPSSEIPRFERAFEAGQYLIVVHPRDLAEAKEVENVMAAIGAESAKSYVTP